MLFLMRIETQVFLPSPLTRASSVALSRAAHGKTMTVGENGDAVFALVQLYAGDARD
jgi:hypothetical protein